MRVVHSHYFEYHGIYIYIRVAHSHCFVYYEHYIYIYARRAPTHIIYYKKCARDENNTKSVTKYDVLVFIYNKQITFKLDSSLSQICYKQCAYDENNTKSVTKVTFLPLYAHSAHTLCYVLGQYILYIYMRVVHLHCFVYYG